MNRLHRYALVSIMSLFAAGVAIAESPDTRWLNPEFLRDAKPEPAPTNRTEIDLIRFFGSDILEWGNNRFSMPLRQEQHIEARRSLLVNVLAIEWQHSLNAANFLTLSARYGDSLSSDTEVSAASGTSAVLSWNSLLSTESRLSGRLYVGDEESKRRTNGERRYFGMHLEGRYSLWRDHTPFASLRWQRAQYDVQDNGLGSGSLLRYESSSRLAAGWNWQLSPGWDMRAEANYRLGDEGLDATDSDRTQLYFSTHYGFR